MLLTRTDVFVEELRPVVTKPQVQEALTDGIVQGVLGAVDLQPAIEKALEAPIRTQAAALVASPQVDGRLDHAASARSTPSSSPSWRAGPTRSSTTRGGSPCA